MASDCENARTYYHYACDSLGSITHVVAGNELDIGETDDNINSRILCRYKYDAFGNTINTEEIITNRYGFTGEMHDDITDMYYLRARYYVPYTGRFTQADTYHGDGLNLYVYGGNNPVKYVDPSGHYKNNGIKSGSVILNNGIPNNPQMVRRFMSKKEYKQFKKNGFIFNPNDPRGGISSTSTKIKPNNTDRIKRSTGALGADYYVDINVSNKKIFLRGLQKEEFLIGKFKVM